jgi:enoyl-CoA hydratase/carnithine racemase
LQWARSFASGPAAAISLAKRAIDEGLERSLVEGLDLEEERFADALETNDAAVGIASFLEHGPGTAHFTGS